MDLKTFGKRERSVMRKHDKLLNSGKYSYNHSKLKNLRIERELLRIELGWGMTYDGKLEFGVEDVPQETLVSYLSKEITNG